MPVLLSQDNSVPERNMCSALVDRKNEEFANISVTRQFSMMLAQRTVFLKLLFQSCDVY